jgi:type 1 glutamine amidotransferase
MILINIFIRKTIFYLFLLTLFFGCGNKKNIPLINVLILSGRNNHEWQKTTPVIAEIYKNSGLFSVKITEKPDTLTYKELKTYDVVVSNWNSFPDTSYRMPEERESDLLRYVNEGGGFVIIHAGASSFYTWPEYYKIGIGRWGKETSHGKITRGKVSGFDQTNPVTKGFADFYIVDEIWEKTDIYPGAKPIAFISAINESDGKIINEPVIFTCQYGKGLIFFTSLGHDEQSLSNSGLQEILKRGGKWAAGRN